MNNALKSWAELGQPQPKCKPDTEPRLYSTSWSLELEIEVKVWGWKLEVGRRIEIWRWRLKFRVGIWHQVMKQFAVDAFHWVQTQKKSLLHLKPKSAGQKNSWNWKFKLNQERAVEPVQIKQSRISTGFILKIKGLRYQS